MWRRRGWRAADTKKLGSQRKNRPRISRLREYHCRLVRSLLFSYSHNNYASLSTGLELYGIQIVMAIVFIMHGSFNMLIIFI